MALTIRRVRLVTLLGAGALLLTRVSAQTMPSGLKEYLERQVKFTPQELASVTSGQAVAKDLDSQGEELGVVGVVYIAVPPDYLFRGYEQFDKLKVEGPLQFGRFGNPAQPADAAKLTLDPDDFKALRNCKPGDCDVELPDQAIERFHNEIDWKAPDAAEKADALYRMMLAHYMADYQKRGDEALLTFHNRRDPKSVREGLQQLLANTPDIVQAMPQLIAHLQGFPRVTRADSKDYFFWIKSDTGMKPVTAAAHLVIHKETAANGKTVYVFAAKSMFANHYFRDAMAFRFLVPATSDANPKALYYVSLTRAHADGLTGVKGKLIRGKLIKGMQDTSVDHLSATKNTIEEWYRTNAPSR